MKKVILLSIALALVSSSFSLASERDKWNTSNSTHFIVYYKNASEDFITKLIDESENYYNKIADDLGFTRFNFWLWDNRAKIYVYDDAKEYRKATAQPEWSYGVAIPGQKTIQTFPYAQGFFETILPHEMSHIIFREFVGFNNPAVPLWLEEGVASYQEKSKYLTARVLIKEAIVKGNFMSLEKLSSYGAPLSLDSGSAAIFYAEAYSLTDFLVKESGKDNFVFFCQNLRDKRNFERALASNYPYSNIRELDKIWQDYLKK